MSAQQSHILYYDITLTSYRSWTAVVQGGVIYGIEKARHRNTVFAATFKRSYGAVLNQPCFVRMRDGKDRFVDPLTEQVHAERQINWLIHKGDLMSSHTMEKDINWSFGEHDNRVFKLPIYTYIHDEEDETKPDRFETGQYGMWISSGIIGCSRLQNVQTLTYKPELEEVAKINVDLSQSPISNFERRRNSSTRQSFYIAYMKCLIIISEVGLELQVLLNGHQLSSTKINCSALCYNLYGVL